MVLLNLNGTHLIIRHMAYKVTEVSIISIYKFGVTIVVIPHSFPFSTQ